MVTVFIKAAMLGVILLQPTSTLFSMATVRHESQELDLSQSTDYQCFSDFFIRAGGYNVCESAFCQKEQLISSVRSLPEYSAHSMLIADNPLKITHDWAVTTIKGDLTGKYFVTVSLDGVAQIINISQQKIIRAIRHEKSITSISCSPDGRFIATSSADGTVKIVDLLEPQVDGGSEVVLNYGYPVNSVSFSESGNFLITASDDGMVKIFDVPSRTYLASFDCLDKAQLAVCNRDETHIAVFVGNDKVCIIQRDTEKMTTLSHGGWVNTIQWNARGDKVASSSNDNTAKVFDITMDQEIVLPHDGSVRTASFGPDGMTLLTTSDDKNTRIWDLETQKALKTIKNKFWVHTRAIAFKFA